MSSVRRFVRGPAWLATILLVAAPLYARDELRLLDVELPAEFIAALPTEGLTAVAGDGAGLHFAVAVQTSEKPLRSEVRLFRAGAAESRSVRVKGIVRDLWFDPDGALAYGIVFHPAKRGTGAAELWIVDVASGTSRRSIRLPPTSTALDYWGARNALLVAARDEVRTILLPGVRSGPLFRVPGPNLSLSALDGGGRLLIGRDDGIWRIDLNDRPDEHTMPVRERLATAQPVVSMATSRDGDRTLARLADGTLLEVTASPLVALPAGRALAVEATGVKPIPEVLVARVVEEPPAPVRLTDTAPAQRKPQTAPASEADSGPAPTTPVETAPSTPPPIDSATPTEPPPPSTPQPPTVTREPVTNPSVESASPEPDAATAETVAEPPVPEPDAATATAVAEPPVPEPDAATATAVADRAVPEPQDVSTTETAEAARPAAEATPAIGSAHQLHGSVGGAAADQVKWVVFLGPDNILREALRVAPAGDGSWSAGGLAPGRYRVTLDGGGDRLLVSRPAWVLVEIGDETGVEAPAFDVLRTR